MKDICQFLNKLYIVLGYNNNHENSLSSILELVGWMQPPIHLVCDDYYRSTKTQVILPSNQKIHLPVTVGSC